MRTFWDIEPIGGSTNYRKVSTKGKVPNDLLRTYPKGFAIVYRACLQGAIRRGLDFTLTPKQAYDIATKPCKYCGDIASNCTLDFAYNGIDRVDNRIGYNDDNAVSCCKTCNRMKGKMSVNEFTNHAWRIANNG